MRDTPIHPLRDVLACEARFDRAYDEQTASHVVVVRDGHHTLAGSYDRPLLEAMVREVMAG